MFAPVFLIALCLLTVNADHQTYPGTKTRPVLSDAEAASYTKAAYLQGWSPSSIQTSKADYTVGSGGYSTIQAAINDAINAGGSTRKYIHIQPGTYKQLVLIPKTSVPLTIYGTPGSPGDVVITLTQSAKTSGSTYSASSGASFKDGDPAWSMFHNCASKSEIGTTCSAVFWAQNDDLEVAYLTVNNPAQDAQAVAVETAGDKQHFDNVHFYGYQDTLLAGGKRVYFSKPTIKGDVDFIFGSASAVFEGAEIVARGDRRNTAMIFAPDTPNTQKYGYLLIDSKITADSSVKSNHGCHLARAWDASSVSNANGQLVIRETEIDNVLNVNAPYDKATSGRAYSGNIATNRNLDDANYNRFWEYKNTGSGA